MKYSNLIKYINDNNLGNIKEDELMADHCSIKVGGCVKAVFYPNKSESIIRVIEKCKEEEIAYKIIGRGSNIIFPDGNVNQLFIKIATNLDEMNILDNNIIYADAGYSLQKLSKVLSKQGYMGLEFAGGIPASLGGAVYMNAGAHTGEMKDIVKEVVCIDANMNIIKLSNDACKFTYRHSIFQEKDYIIIGCYLKMQKSDDTAKIFKLMSGNLEYRKEMQPLNWPSFGSVFKNPKGSHAGKIIDELGLKGYKIGGAKVSTKHANFIINTGGASSKDVKELIRYIQKEAHVNLGIDLETEVEIFKDHHE